MSRIHGVPTAARRRLLALADVAVGYETARRSDELTGWVVEAVVVAGAGRSDPDLVALRAAPRPGLDVEDLVPVGADVLVRIGERIARAAGDRVRVVADVATPPPLAPARTSGAPISAAWWWADDARSA